MSQTKGQKIIPGGIMSQTKGQKPALTETIICNGLEVIISRVPGTFIWNNQTIQDREKVTKRSVKTIQNGPLINY